MRAGILILGVVLLSSCGQEESYRGPDCRPTYHPASADVITVELGTWKLLFRATLIGCEQDLAPLDAKEEKEIVHALASAPDADYFALAADPNREEFRREMLAKIREILGSDAVSDLLVHDVHLVVSPDVVYEQ